MKPWKKKQKFILAFIVILCFEFYKCDDLCPNCESTDGISSCTSTTTDPSDCNSDCKPKYISGGTSQCYNCGSNSGYYTIDSYGECLNDCVGDKIIEGSKECTSRDLSSLFKLGDFYYNYDPSSPSNSEIDCQNKICYCKNYYNIETIYGKKKYNCFAFASPPSGYTYYSSKTKEFFQTGCPNGLNIKKVDSGITRCSDACMDSEYYLAIPDTDNNIINEYCNDNCDGNTYSGYKYKYTANGILKCLNGCPDGTYIKDDSDCVTLDQCDYYDSADKKCYSTCTGTTTTPAVSGPTGKPYHNYGSKECIVSCTGDYLYEKVVGSEKTCFRKQDCNFVDDSTSPKKCLDSCNSGSNKYHNYDSKICINACNDASNSKKYHAENDYICYSSCSEIPGGEYIYERDNDHICYKTQQTTYTDCEAYYLRIDGIRKCSTRANCITNNKQYFLGNECKNSCDGLYQIKITPNSGDPYINCFETLADALTDTTNVKYCDKSQRKCWKDFPTDDTYYIKSILNNANSQYEIVRECPNFYCEKATPSDINWCVDSCKDGGCASDIFFISGNKKCLNSCKDKNKYYYDDNNECIDSCELRPTIPFSYPLIIPSVGSPPTPEPCKSSCDTSSRGEYYNYNSHVCLLKCGDDHSNNLYFLSTAINDPSHSKICYPSCLDIPGGSYKYELNDNSCTNTEITTLPTSDYYYEKSNGVIKYVKAIDCKNLNYIYLVGKECKRNCDDSYYKIKVQIEISPGSPPTLGDFIKCFPEPSQCSQAITGTTLVYYNQNLKKCWNDIHDIPTNYFLKEIDTNLYELVDECENYYHKKTDNFNYCTPLCKIGPPASPTLNLFFIRGNKKCETDCANFNKYYYDPNDNECLDTCKGRPKYKFQKELPSPLPTSASSCLENCPNDSGNNNVYPFYSYDSNVCLSNCGADGSNNKYHKDAIPTACYPSCLDIPPGDDGNYIYELEGTDGISTCYDSTYTFTSTSPYYYLKTDGTKKITNAAGCKAKNFIYIVGNECRDKCEDEYYQLEKSLTVDSGNSQFIKCFQTPNGCYSELNPSGSSPVTSVYYNAKLKKCWKDFPDDYYIKDKTATPANSPYELVEECDNFYYVGSSPTENICIGSCISPSPNTYYISGNKKCLSFSECSALGRYYTDSLSATSKECLESCKEISKYQPDLTSSPSTSAIECLSNCQDGTPYYNYDSNICLSLCGADGSNNKYHTTSITNIACYPSCLDIPGRNYIYEKEDTPNNGVFSCSIDIPSGCNYYYISSDGTRKCTTITDCYNKGFTYIVGQECKNKCENDYYKLDDKFSITVGGLAVQKPFVICLQTIDDCKTYGTASTTTDPLYYNEKLKKCWKTFPWDYYIKNKGTTSLDKYELVEKCDDYYYVYTVDTTPKENICTSNCKTLTTPLYFIKGNQKCMALTDCFLLNRRYYDPENNECLDSCKGRPTYKYQTKLTGSETVMTKCLEKCPIPDSVAGITANLPYYDFDSNICLSECGKVTEGGDPNKKFHANDGTVCYSSCAEILGGEYTYESGGICYKNQNTASSCTHYYLKPNGEKQCTNQGGCIGKNYKFFIVDIKTSGSPATTTTNYECRDNCDGYYKREDTSSTDKITYCYSSLTKAKEDTTNVKFYNIKSKLCWTTYPTGYYILSYVSGSTQDEVVEECPNYYYKSDGNFGVANQFYCTDKCKVTSGIDLHFAKGQKNCESTCDKFNKYFYDPDDKECLDTCKGRTGKELALKDSLVDGKQIYKCKDACPTTGTNPVLSFHDYDSNICIDECGKDNPNYLYHTDIGSSSTQDKICYPSCKDIPGEYLYESKDTTGTKIQKCYTSASVDGSGSTLCPYYYMKKDGTLKCLNGPTDCVNMKYNYLLGNECRSECNDYFKLEDDTSDGLIKCFSTQTKCLATTASGGGGATYFNTKLKKCWQNYPDGYYMKDGTQTSNIEMLEECEHFYYRKQETTPSTYAKYICTDNCKTADGLFFESGKKNCEESCKTFGKYYFDPNTNECLDTCIGNNNNLEFADFLDFTAATAPGPTTCKISCDSTNQVYSYGSKICRSSCDTTMKYRKYNNADIICYESCAQIPGGKYIYESESGNICYTKIEIETITTIDCALYYPQNDGTMKCITAANEATSNCKSKGFNFVFGKECRNNCDNYYKLMDGPSTDPKKCFATLQEIKAPSENIKYYDPLLKQSWLNYPSSLYIKDEEEIDSTHSIFEVVEDCPKFYYEVIDDSNSPTIITYKYCVDDCNSKNLNLFFNQGNNKCKASCKDFSKKYYDPTNHECLETCLGRPNLKYAFPINANNDPQPCLEKCPSTKYFISKKDANYVITNYECVDTCPFPNTGTSTHSKLDIKTKECRDACDSNIHIEANNICYPKCDLDNNYKYINTDTNECVLACPSELKKIVKLGTTGIYLCKSLCEDPLPYRFGDECVSQCPDGHNYIGYNNICKTKCAEDANGERYYPTNADNLAAGQHIIYKCIDSCQEAIIDPGDATKNYLYYKKSEPNICLRSCTSGAPNYLSSNSYECLSGCPDEIPFYDKSDSSNHYLCQANTICNTDPNLYFIDGECVSDCTVNGKNYIDSRKICLDKCPEYEIKKKLTSADNTYECRKNCGNEYIFKENEASEPECVTDCPQGMPYIGKDNVCKTSCSEEDGVYFYSKTEINGPPSYKIFQCVDGCNPDHEYKYKAINNDKQCYKQCADTEVFLYLAEDENLCYDDCLKSEHNQFRLTQHNSGGDITGRVCTTQCETTVDKYWGENKVCVANCNDLGPNKLLDGNRCVDKCGEYNIQNKYQLDTTCVNDCSVDTQNPKRLRYSKTNYICKLKCGTEEYLIRETNECVTTCNDYIDLLLDTSTPPVLTGEKECVHSCESINKFYYPTRKMCLMKCNNNDKVVDELNMCVNNCAEIKNYIETNDNYYLSEGAGTYNDATSTSYDKCVKECPAAKPYIDNDKCEAQCPIGRKYFIQSDINPDKKCLIDCPTNYPYFTENTGANPCKAECTGYYVPNYDTNKIAKLCLPSCPSTSYTQYKFKLEYTNNTKEIRECYETCPDGFKYHYAAGNTDNNCYKECPPDAPYHKEGETICLKQAELTTGYLLYDIKELITGVTKCPDEYNLYTKITVVSDTINICLKECNFEYYNSARGYIKYEYLTPYKTCVDDCTSTSNDLVSGKHLIPDELEKECICENLYYISETTFEKVCYDPSITECKNTVAPNHNPYPLYGTKQCLKACNNDRILNPPEDTCYEKDTPCSSVNEYSTLITTNTGQKKCDCAFSFYLDTNDNNKKHCLAEGDYCYSGSYNLYIPELKQCVSSCPTTYPKNFKNFCLRNCPSGSEVDGNTCKCQKDATNDKLWYQTSTSNFVCIEGDCPDNFPLYVENTKQCLTSCKGTHYPNLFESKCYHDCDSTGIANIIQMQITSDLASFKCDCPLPWYYDNDNKMVCPPNDGTIQKCKDHNKGLNFMIDETRQCVKECPSEYPYYFNNKCYKSCEEANEKYELNIELKESSFECVCPNLWFIDPNDSYKKDKICYRKDINECPRTADITVPSTRYLIYNTKECVNARSECPTNSYKFNFICYDKCPEFTLEGKEPVTAPDNTIIQDNICVCNTNGYLYLDYEKYGNKYYRCGLVTCPEIFINEEQEEVRKNLLESENKCVKNCTEDGKSDNEYIKSFRNTCVKKCPNKTETYYDECRFYELTDEDNIDDLNKLKEAANIQAKELYEESEQMSGYLLNKFDASLQIYALSRYNNNKDLIMKSNLTYIDLGTCLERIYEDGNLEDDDKILVTKYDLLTRNNKNNNDDGNNDDGDEEPQESIDDKYLINQVEYEFFLESTMEKIEGSICNPYEIEISYPIFFNKNRFNNFAGGINANDYQNKFRIGKELHSKDAEIDTFNKDNKVYKDLCVGVELNGKDLVLEERYDYLYPNNVSICESNCTMKNTDFDLERINCMCTYKEIFDFNRVDEDTNDILNDPNFHKTTQSGANAEIIKCLSKISVKQGIVKNEAFYFSAVVSAVEISMAVVSAVYGVKAVAGFMKGMLGMGQGNSIVNFKKSNPAVTSTNRMLNNPPKKGEENTNEENDEDNKGNIVIKKNIKMNYNPNTINNNEISEIDINNNDNNSNINYGLSIKSGFPKNKKKIDIENEINNKTKVNNKYNTVNLYSNKKAEFIPPQYNFKFFKPNDKGIVKKIERSKIPFDVDKDTKILLETKKDVIYDDNYLDGPFYEDQNVIEIIDDINTNKVIKFNESNNNINNNFDSSVIIKKNANRINNKNDISAKEEIPKSKKRRISNKINSEEKDFITIKKINPITSLQMTVEDYKEEEEVKNVDSTTSIYNLVKREHTYLRVTYERYIAKRHPNILATFLAEILDKIYFIKIFIFLKKFDIFSIHLALYMFYHILLLSLLCGFFTIKVIKKIWEDSNYPTMNFYLLYGFLGNVIIWIIYRIFILLLDNQDRFRALVKLHNESMNNNTSRANLDEDKEIKDNDNNKEVNLNQQDMINEKYEELIKKIKIQTIVFYIIIILITAFCFIYLVSFFAIYTGTKGKVFKAYYISIIEIILIKFVYGLCLASLRIAGEGNELKSLYNFVYYCDKYVS